MFLALFGVDAKVIKIIGDIMYKAIGIGFVLMPFCVVFAGVLLLTSRGKPIALRVICALLIPYFAGAVAHSLIGTTELTIEALTDATFGGGLLAGFPVALIKSGISAIPTIILMITAFLFVILTSFDLTIMDVYDFARDIFTGAYKDDEDEDDEEDDEAEAKEDMYLVDMSVQHGVK